MSVDELELARLRRLKRAASPPPAELSYCVACDALPGECSHNGPRYLEPIEYEDGGRVPAAERARWEAPLLRPEPRPVDVDAVDVEELLDELRAVILFGEKLESKFRALHKLDPLRVTRLTTYVLGACANGGLRSPGGFLWTRLVELERDT